MKVNIAILIFSLFLLLFILTLGRSKTRELYYNTKIKSTPLPLSNKINSIEKRNDNTIFISIASYRDKDCIHTIIDCFEKAKYPKNITLGICQQNKDEDMDCIYNEHYEKIKNYHPQIKVIRIPFYEARGPTFARYWCATLWEGENYFMQIDSHTRFEKDWDEKCLSMVKGFNKKEIVLSTYPPEIGHETSDSVTIICSAFFNEPEDMLSFPGAGLFQSPKVPIETAFIAGGFFFTDASFLKEIPFDPHLPDLFVGEEILQSMRFWTHGWDIYAPNQNIVYHHYTRADEPKVWGDRNMDSRLSKKKVKTLMGFSNEEVPHELNYKIEQYGLGDKRSIQDFYNFIGYDFKEKKCNKDFCKDIR
jgi:hypothetical protein